MCIAATSLPAVADTYTFDFINNTYGQILGRGFTTGSTTNSSEFGGDGYLDLSFESTPTASDQYFVFLKRDDKSGLVMAKLNPAKLVLSSTDANITKVEFLLNRNTGKGITTYRIGTEDYIPNDYENTDINNLTGSWNGSSKKVFLEFNVNQVTSVSINKIIVTYSKINRPAAAIPSVEEISTPLMDEEQVNYSTGSFSVTSDLELNGLNATATSNNPNVVKVVKNEDGTFTWTAVAVGSADINVVVTGKNNEGKNYRGTATIPVNIFRNGVVSKKLDVTSEGKFEITLAEQGQFSLTATPPGGESATGYTWVITSDSRNLTVVPSVVDNVATVSYRASEAGTYKVTAKVSAVSTNESANIEYEASFTQIITVNPPVSVTFNIPDIEDTETQAGVMGSYTLIATDNNNDIVNLDASNTTWTVKATKPDAIEVITNYDDHNPSQIPFTFRSNNAGDYEIQATFNGVDKDGKRYEGSTAFLVRVLAPEVVGIEEEANFDALEIAKTGDITLTAPEGYSDYNWTLSTNNDYLRLSTKTGKEQILKATVTAQREGEVTINASFVATGVAGKKVTGSWSKTINVTGYEDNGVARYENVLSSDKLIDVTKAWSTKSESLHEDATQKVTATWNMLGWQIKENGNQIIGGSINGSTVISYFAPKDVITQYSIDFVSFNTSTFKEIKLEVTRDNFLDPEITPDWHVIYLTDMAPVMDNGVAVITIPEEYRKTRMFTRLTVTGNDPTTNRAAVIKGITLYAKDAPVLANQPVLISLKGVTKADEGKPGDFTLNVAPEEGDDVLKDIEWNVICADVNLTISPQNEDGSYQFTSDVAGEYKVTVSVTAKADNDDETPYAGTQDFKFNIYGPYDPQELMVAKFGTQNNLSVGEWIYNNATEGTADANLTFGKGESYIESTVASDFYISSIALNLVDPSRYVNKILLQVSNNRYDWTTIGSWENDPVNPNRPAAGLFTAQIAEKDRQNGLYVRALIESKSDKDAPLKTLKTDGLYVNGTIKTKPRVSFAWNYNGQDLDPAQTSISIPAAVTLENMTIKTLPVNLKLKAYTNDGTDYPVALENVKVENLGVDTNFRYADNEAVYGYEIEYDKPGTALLSVDLTNASSDYVIDTTPVQLTLVITKGEFKFKDLDAIVLKHKTDNNYIYPDENGAENLFVDNEDIAKEMVWTMTPKFDLFGVAGYQDPEVTGENTNNKLEFTATVPGLYNLRGQLPEVVGMSDYVTATSGNFANYEVVILPDFSRDNAIRFLDNQTFAPIAEINEAGEFKWIMHGDEDDPTLAAKLENQKKHVLIDLGDYNGGTLYYRINKKSSAPKRVIRRVQDQERVDAIPSDYTQYGTHGNGIDLTGATGVDLIHDLNGVKTSTNATFSNDTPIITGVDGIDADGENVEYFTVDGLQVSAPLAPGLYIRRSGSESQMIIVR